MDGIPIHIQGFVYWIFLISRLYELFLFVFLLHKFIMLQMYSVWFYENIYKGMLDFENQSFNSS